MDAAGQNIRTLSFHETNEWHPSVLNDGRIVYTRWDYVDRSAANFHGLWTSNPDGTQPEHPLRQLHGADQRLLPAAADPRLAADRVRRRGAPCRRGRLAGARRPRRAPASTPRRARTASSRSRCSRRRSAFPRPPAGRRATSTAPGRCRRTTILVSFSFDPLPGMGPDGKQRQPHGPVLLRPLRQPGAALPRAGHLLHVSDPAGAAAACRRSCPARSTRRWATRASSAHRRATEPHAAAGGPADPAAARLPGAAQDDTHVANQPRLGHANAESARMLLGTVPVEADGSAYFRVPGRQAALFPGGRCRRPGGAEHAERHYLQPGERRGCVGCHEPPGDDAGGRSPAGRPPGTVGDPPGPDGTRPFSLLRGSCSRVLDRHCVRCHDGADQSAAGRLAWTAGRQRRSAARTRACGRSSAGTSGAARASARSSRGPGGSARTRAR